MQAEQLDLRGRLEVVLRDRRGRFKARRSVDNLITTIGKQDIVDAMLATVVNPKVGWMAVGNQVSPTAPAVGDTALQAEVATTGRKALATKTGVATNVLTMVANWPAGDATATLTEAGLFSAASAGRMQARATYTAIVKGASDTLQITWTWTIG